MLKLLALALCVHGSPSAASEAPLFDLVANRTLAHSQAQGGFYTAAGQPGFAKYVHFSRPTPTWKLQKLVDGHRVALPSTQAVLEVPLTAAQARSANVTLRLWSPVKQSLKISAGGALGNKPGASAAVPVSDGWQTLVVPVPAGTLTEGETKLLLTFAQSATIAGLKASAAVEWIAIGNAAPLPDAPLALASRAGLQLAPQTGLAYYVQIPDGGSLALQGELGGCAVALGVSHGSKKLVDGSAAPGAAIDLAAASGKVVRLELSAEGSTCTRTKLTGALQNAAAPALL